MNVRIINRNITCPDCGHRGMVLIRHQEKAYLGCERYPVCHARMRVHPNGKPFTKEQEALHEQIDRAEMPERFIEQSI